MKRLFPAIAALSISAHALGDDRFSVTTGVDYSTGKYGNATSTDILYVPVTAQYETGRLSLRLTVPYISVTGPGGVIRGVGRIVSPTGASGVAPAFGRGSRMATTTTTITSTTNSGLGDVIAAAGYNVYSATTLAVDVVGKIKFGTADANKGLGTGENDYALQVDGYYTVVPKTTLFATAGYKIVGAPPGIAVNNVPYGVLGVDRKTGDTTNVGAMLGLVKSITAAGSDQRDVTVYAVKKVSDRVKVQASLLKGLADGSPDYGGGLMITGYF